MTWRGKLVTFTTHSPETPENSRRLTVADVVAAYTAEHIWELQRRLGSLVRDDIAPSDRRGLRPLTMYPGKSAEVTTPASSASPSITPNSPAATPTPPPATSTSLPASSTEVPEAKEEEKSSAQEPEYVGIRCFRCHGHHHVRDCPERKSPITCLACKGLHHVNDCPRRAEFKPPKPCNKCGGEDHWQVDCPGKQPIILPVTWDGRTQLAHRRCYVCGERGHSAKDCTHRAERKPPQACPVCEQEGHWVFDCPELPNRPDFVIKDCSYCGGMHYLQECRSLQRSKEARRKRNAAHAT